MDEIESGEHVHVQGLLTCLSVGNGVLENKLNKTQMRTSEKRESRVDVPEVVVVVSDLHHTRTAGTVIQRNVDFLRLESQRKAVARNTRSRS